MAMVSTDQGGDPLEHVGHRDRQPTPTKAGEEPAGEVFAGARHERLFELTR